MMGYDVVALGELLVDFVPCGVGAYGQPVYEANPGGAPCNVLAMLSRLGRRTAFVGRVGLDGHGQMLRDAVAAQGIGTEHVRFDTRVPTTLAFVHLLAGGDRNFTFYRNPGADMMLRAEDVPEALLADTRIFHFGSVSMTDDTVFEATAAAVAMAEAHGVLRSFDPNLRLPLWKSEEDARRRIRYGLAHCDILKIADNELVWLTGEKDFSRGMEALLVEFELPLVLLTLGRDGGRAYCRGEMVEMTAYETEQTIDTTGAGDTFFACMLHGVLGHGIDTLGPAVLREMLGFANAAASLVTTKKGALCVMPGLEEVVTWQRGCMESCVYKLTDKSAE